MKLAVNVMCISLMAIAIYLQMQKDTDLRKVIMLLWTALILDGIANVL